MRLSFICSIALLLAGFLSCKKDTIDVNSFWQCNQGQNTDTAVIANKLTGSWYWTKQACASTGATRVADKKIRLTFKVDHTFTITESNSLLTMGTWKIVQVDGSSRGLDLSSPSEYLYGRILFCDNQVLFNDSYRDGCDNLFTKNN